MNWLYVLISSAMVYFFVGQINKKDKENKLKRFYSFFAFLFSAIFATILFFAGKIDGNWWNIVMHTCVIYAANHLVGQQLLTKLLKKVEG